MCIMNEYLGSRDEQNEKVLEEILGPRPLNKSLFRNKHFILTCTISRRCLDDDASIKDMLTNKYHKFSSLPFIKDHLIKQIEDGGGTIYNNFEEIPKSKYKQCKILAPHPCQTARYIQCLAADIPAISHEWIVETCRKGSLVDIKPYLLPSGWSVLENRYIRWAVGRSFDQRSQAQSFGNKTVLMATQCKDFEKFWTRVCKLAGATVRIIKSATDVTRTLKDCTMLTDEEFPQEIKSKAEHYGIPIVSTNWVVQSLIVGKMLQPDAHELLKKVFIDDDF